MAETTVLVVEDQEGLADLYTEWLSEEYSVSTAYTAAGALDELNERVDIALLDRRLPDSSGDEILEQIREQGLDCRVAMVTAVDPDFDILELGFDAYLVKPVDRDDLLDLIRKLRTRSLYGEEIHEYFALVSKRAALEEEKSAAELDASDEYAELTERLAALQEDLDSRVDELEEEDFLALFHEL